MTVKDPLDAVAEAAGDLLDAADAGKPRAVIDRLEKAYAAALESAGTTSANFDPDDEEAPVSVPTPDPDPAKADSPNPFLPSRR
ncbi:MAG: hypothetical protein ACRC7O_06075 [Fimbriiglobus sp.]